MKLSKYFAVFLVGFILALIIMGATEPYRHNDTIIFVPVEVVPVAPSY